MKQLNTIAILAGAAALLFACGKGENPGEPAPKATAAGALEPAPAKQPAQPISQKELKLRLEALLKAVNARDSNKLAEFYAGDAELVYAGADGQKIKKAAMLEGAEAFFAAFPDAKTEGVFLFMNGSDQTVIVRRTVGTNTGEFMGTPATNKKIGIVAAHHITTNPQGQIRSEVVYMDQVGWAGQLGMVPEGMFRPAVELSGNPPQVIATADSDAEMQNLDLVENLGKAVNARNVDKIMEYYAGDAVFSYVAGPKDHQGTDEIAKGLAEWFKMSSDVAVANSWAWAAGDYVVAATTTRGTNDGEMPGGMAATNKAFTTSELHVYQIAGGKVARHWIFANGMEIAKQLDLMPKPGAAPAQGQADKAEK